MSERHLLAALSLSLLLGCSPAQPLEPTYESVPRVTVAPQALPLAASLGNIYRDEIGPLPFDLVPRSTEAGLEEAAEGQALFHLDFPPVPSGWFAVPLGWEGIAVIVDPEVTTRAVDRADLRQVFAGRQTDWGDEASGGSPIQLVAPIPSDRLFQHFRGLIGLAEPLPTTAIIAPVPEAAIAYVESESGAIGLLPFSTGLPDSIRVLRVDGALPAASTIADGRYPLRVELLAMAPEEPEAGVLEWLIWAQSAGQRPPEAPTNSN